MCATTTHALDCSVRVRLPIADQLQNLQSARSGCPASNSGAVSLGVCIDDDADLGPSLLTGFEAGAPMAALRSSTMDVMRDSNASCKPPTRFATTSSSTVPTLLLAPRVAATVAAAALTSVRERLSSTPAPTAMARAGHG